MTRGVLTIYTTCYDIFWYIMLQTYNNTRFQTDHTSTSTVPSGYRRTTHRTSSNIRFPTKTDSTSMQRSLDSHEETRTTTDMTTRCERSVCGWRETYRTRVFRQKIWLCRRRRCPFSSRLGWGGGCCGDGRRRLGLVLGVGKRCAR